MVRRRLRIVRLTKGFRTRAFEAMSSQFRAFCYRCFRPEKLCLCPFVESVDNRTGIQILQHPRERFHPFNSARLLALSLRQCRVRVAYRNGVHSKRVACAMVLPENTALLYPRSDAVSLPELSLRPSNLLLLDGTWSQAHRLYMDNPWLAELPCVTLPQAEPSLFRIRREPKPHCLSTLEAAVRALRIVEPATRGLDSLLAAFVRMNEDQVRSRRAVTRVPRRKRGRRRAERVVPAALRDGQRLVLVYGESAQLQTRSQRRVAQPFQWVAVRPSTGEVFERFVRPARGAPTAEYLRCTGLSHADLAATVPMSTVVREFVDFLGPDGTLACWHASTARMARLMVPGASAVVLKHVYANRTRARVGTLEQVIEREGLEVAHLTVAGRAAARLASAAAVWRWIAASHHDGLGFP